MILPAQELRRGWSVSPSHAAGSRSMANCPKMAVSGCWCRVVSRNALFIQVSRRTVAPMCSGRIRK
eukprot:3694306-Pyramimonas_sp.AAC.1